MHNGWKGLLRGEGRRLEEVSFCIAMLFGIEKAINDMMFSFKNVSAVSMRLEVGLLSPTPRQQEVIVGRSLGTPNSAVDV